MMLNIKIKAKAKPTTKAKRTAFAAFAQNDKIGKDCPELNSFKPRAFASSHSLFCNDQIKEEDEEVISRLALEFKGEGDESGTVKTTPLLLDGEEEENDLYEEGKFKMSKMDSSRTGLIKVGGNEQNIQARYVDKLLKSAALREAEREIIHEAKLVKDIERESRETGNQPKAYVTGGYKRRLAERQAAAEQLAQRETVKDAGDLRRLLITKQFADQ